MKHALQFYIDGSWVAPVGGATLEVVNPATEEAYARIAMGEKADVDKAVAAAKRAFETFSRTSRKERVQLLESVIAVYKKYADEMAAAISDEMGAPLGFAKDAQVGAGLGHLSQVLEVLRTFEFDEVINNTLITREPIGVCGFITPWNWPMNQITCKVGPALATGCTMVLKPSEVAPMSGLLFTQIIHEAGVPAGVYNMVNGDGPSVGQAISTHPDIDMVSFTGSTRAGIAVAHAAADTVKRVSQELGGKSPNLILPDADFLRAVTHGARQCFSNSGQSCNAPTRMLVPADRQEEVIEIARKVAEQTIVGDPRDPTYHHRTGGQQGAVRQDPGADRGGHRRRRASRSRRAGPARKPQPRLLHPPDDLRRRAQRHDHCARGDLRTRSRDPALRQRGRSDRHRQRHDLRPLELRHVGQSRPCAAGCAAGSAPAWCTQRRARGSSRVPSAATSSPATVGSGASSASRTSSRSNRCSAIRRREHSKAGVRSTDPGTAKTGREVRG